MRPFTFAEAEDSVAAGRLGLELEIVAHGEGSLGFMAGVS